MEAESRVAAEGSVGIGKTAAEKTFLKRFCFYGSTVDWRSHPSSNGEVLRHHYEAAAKEGIISTQTWDTPEMRMLGH